MTAVQAAGRAAGGANDGRGPGADRRGARRAAVSHRSHARRPPGDLRAAARPWRLTVGRRAESDIALAWDVEVSRAHALLEQVGEQWTLVDDGLSSNGSFVNGLRVVGRQRLRQGDRLCFGNTQLLFRDPGPAESEATRRETPTAVPLTPGQHKLLVALCRPLNDASSALPATNRQIADEVFLSVDAVKAQLRLLFDRFGLAELPQNEKRVRLAQAALAAGAVLPHDF